MICLIRPPAIECFRFATTSVTLPLGLAYIAGALEAAGHKVQVIDAVGEGPKQHTRYFKGYMMGLSLEQIVERIPSDADAIGISVIFTHEWPMAVRMIEMIKRRLPTIPVIVGGEHGTAMPEFSLMTSQVDVMVLGEGEETIVELVDALRDGRDLATVPGIAYRRGDSVQMNRRRTRRADIDDVAWPAWQHFKIETYSQQHYVGGMFTGDLSMPILATRGCPYQCTYCSSVNMWTPKWIPRDPIKVVDEIEHYVKVYGAGSFPFQDLTAIIEKDWILRFCKELQRRNLKISWQLASGTRSEAIDSEVAEELRKSGMIMMSYAPESGSETTRKYIKKKMKTDRLLGSLQSAASAGLNIAIFLVIGFPHDKVEHFEENFPFIDAVAKAGASDLSISFYMALPGTELFHSLYDAGKIKIDRQYFTHILDSLSLLPSQTYSDISRLQLAWWKLRLLFAFYGSRRRVREKTGLVGSVWRALSGLSKGASHNSKLQTAVRNALISGLNVIKVQMSPRWIPLAEEKAMFARWDHIYRSVRQRNIAAGTALVRPLDTSQLYKTNVIALLDADHGSPRTMPALQ